MANNITFAINGTVDIVTKTLEGLKEYALKQRIIEGRTRKEYWDGFIQALITTKDIINQGIKQGDKK